MPVGNENASKRGKNNKIIKLQKNVTAPGKPASDICTDDVIFAMDIGTRTIVGIAGIKEKDRFRVIAAEVREHTSRAMLDGQIHDVDRVASVASEVKKKIEASIGIKLTKVAIAAAGRVLKTCEVRVERDIDQSREIDPELVNSLEIEGIQMAQEKLDREVSKEEQTQFYCVGYSVTNYYLDNYAISKLSGHKAQKIGADVLATFLPHIVVDSLYTVMSKIGLEVSSLTLEPIAAINVTIPRDLRLLNLTLVDIGAGTSDIAITRDGSVVAYAMVPIAGDEITEVISRHFLVDFNTAEKIKISLSSGHEPVKFTNILGQKKAASIKEFLELIDSTVELLAENIARRILEYNQKAPNAVFLIGGGSQIHGLTEKLAFHLKLSPDRIVVRKRDIVQNVRYTGRKLSGPEAITPLGIALTALEQRGKDFLTVTLNGNKVKLFNSRKLTVADTLILVGFDAGQLIGRTGKSLNFELNGEKNVIRGEHGRVAEIYINGKAASLDTVLTPGDDIIVKPAVNGKNAELNVNSLIDNISSEDIATYGENVDKHTIEITVNGVSVDPGYIIRDNDIITYSLPAAPLPDKTDEIASTAEPQPVINQQPSSGLAGRRPFTVHVNGKPVDLSPEKSKYIFVDIFNYIDFDITKPQGSIVLKLNGSPAAFTDNVSDGDVIDIYWDKKLKG